MRKLKFSREKSGLLRAPSSLSNLSISSLRDLRSAVHLIFESEGQNLLLARMTIPLEVC